MRQIIRLTEDDIRNIVIDSVNEYYMNEGRLHNAAVAGGLALGTLGTLTMSNKVANSDIHFNKVDIPTCGYTSKPSVPNNDTVEFNDYSTLSKPKENPSNQEQDNTIRNDRNGYYPSEKLIRYIKTYETFHDGWVNDKFGNPTTGWGFKITPELKRRFPNGIHSIEVADAYMYEYIDTHMKEFRSITPNLDKLPQGIADALFDLYYNIGGDKYEKSEGLKKALELYDGTKESEKDIIYNIRYAKSEGKVVKGLQRRSTDRQDIAMYGDYDRNDFTTFDELQKYRTNI